MQSGHKFDIGEAMTQPFRLPGGKGLLLKLVLWGTVLLSISYLIFGRAILGAYFDMFGKMMALEGAANDDPAAIMEVMGPMYSIMGWGVLLSILGWAVMASIETAMHRNIFRPHLKTGFFPLRFGKDELRVMLAQLVVYVICTGIYIVGYIIGFILILIVAVLGESVGGAGAALGVLLTIFVVIALIIAALYVLARLSPAAALSVRDEDIRTVEGWRVTKGQIWPLIGSYLIVGVVGNIIISVVMMVGMVAVLATANLPSLFSELEGNEDPSVAIDQLSTAFSTPSVLIPLILTLFIISAAGLIWYMAYWGIANYVVQLDTQKQQDPEFEG